MLLIVTCAEQVIFTIHPYSFYKMPFEPWKFFKSQGWPPLAQIVHIDLVADQ